MVQVESIYTVAKSYLSGYIREKSLTKNSFEYKKLGITAISGIIGFSSKILNVVPAGTIINYFLEGVRMMVFFDEINQWAKETI